MKKNVGSVDRSIRIVVGLGIIAAGIALGSWWGAIGLGPLATGIVGHCPGYLPFGITTCRARG